MRNHWVPPGVEMDRSPLGDGTEEATQLPWEGKDEKLGQGCRRKGGHVCCPVSGRSCVNIRLSFFFKIKVHIQQIIFNIC